MAEKLLTAERAFFEEHFEQYRRQYAGRYLLIHGSELIGNYGDELEAVYEGYRYVWTEDQGPRNWPCRGNSSDIGTRLGAVPDRGAFGTNGRWRERENRPPAKAGDDSPPPSATAGEDAGAPSPYPCSSIHQSMCSSSTTIGIAPLPMTAAWKALMSKRSPRASSALRRWRRISRLPMR